MFYFVERQIKANKEGKKHSKQIHCSGLTQTNYSSLGGTFRFIAALRISNKYYSANTLKFNHN